jgi:hypothetical protein
LETVDRLSRQASERPDSSGDRRYLDGALEFLRIAQATLADDETTFEELFAWESDGPQMRDSTGYKPTGACNVGAIELAP